MRSVIRTKKPESLCQNATRWRDELLDTLSLSEKDRDSKLLNRLYKKLTDADDIRPALEEMYSGLCCYCEAKIGTVSFSHIEHRKPKKRYPKFTFDWDNLHLACQVCNTFKGDKWCDTNPILDSAEDNIPEHLGYKIQGATRWPKSHRGITTIEHAELNRWKLREDRAEIISEVLDIIADINRNPDDPAAGLRREKLEQKTSGKFGSLVQWLMASYLRDPGATDSTP